MSVRQMARLRHITYMAILTIALSPFISIWGPANVTADYGDIDTVTTTSDGRSDVTLTWGKEDIGTSKDLTLDLNPYWTIQEAFLTIDGSPIELDDGNGGSISVYPERPSMDVGGDGRIDWEFEGSLGQQTNFSGDKGALDLSFTDGETKDMNFELPAGAVIQNISIGLERTDPNPYEYTVTLQGSDEVLWQRSSIGFMAGPTISIEPSGVTSVCVDHLDILLDSHRDLVGISESGAVHIVMHEGSSDGLAYSSPIRIDLAGDPPPDLIACVVQDYDMNIENDIFVSSSNGKIFVLHNNGDISWTELGAINMSTSRIEALDVADMNGDGWEDLVAGYITGKIFTSIYNGSSSVYDPPVELQTSTGPIKDLVLADMNQDSFNDIIIASSDGNWWVAFNEKGQGYYDAVPIPSGGDDLTSLAVGDLDLDGSPDLISGNHDGSIYVSFNTGSSFEPGMMLKGGPNAMRDVQAKDLEDDGDVDIIGLNDDGNLYVVRNEFGVLSDSRFLIEAGLGLRSFDLEDIDNDNDLDIVLGGSEGFVVLLNQRGPFDITIGGEGPLKRAIQSNLDGNSATGNVKVPLRMTSSKAGLLKAHDLRIEYDLSTRIDMAQQLTSYINDNRHMADDNGTIQVPLRFKMEGPGGLRVHSISITYLEGLYAMVQHPHYGDVIYENQTMTLTCMINDPSQEQAGAYEYLWTTDGRGLGQGANIEIVGRDLGGLSYHWLRCTVVDVDTTEKYYHEILVKVEPNNVPIIEPVVKKKKVEADKQLKMRVKGQDPDPWDAMNLTFSLEEAPVGLTIDPFDGLMTWIPKSSDIGKHLVIVRLSDGKQFTNESIELDVSGSGIVHLPETCNTTMWLALFSICLIAVGFVLGGTELGIYALFSFILVLYTRLKKEMVLDNFIRGRVFGHISENPGLHFNELKKKLDLPNGTLTYHLRTLEREGLIRSVPNGTRRIFFPAGMKVPKDFLKLTKAQRLVLKVIKENPGITQRKMVVETGLSKSTVNRITIELQEKGLVTAEQGMGRRIKFFAEEA